MSNHGMRALAVIATTLVAALSVRPQRLPRIAATRPAPCSGPVPTVDQVVAIMAELTDPNRSAATKTDIVAPGFSPDEAGIIDDHLNQMNAHEGRLPLNFVVTDIEPAPANFAGATVATTGGYHEHNSPETHRAGRPGRALADHQRHPDGTQAEIRMLVTGPSNFPVAKSWLSTSISNILVSNARAASCGL